MADEYSLVTIAAPDGESARRMADDLLAGRLAASVQLLPIESHYVWKGEVVHREEVLLLVTTRTALYPALETAVAGSHEYEVPEIVRIPVAAGLPAYLDWISAVT
ncbi:MAG: divalent-cation tolerance protein CutA [Actinomycetota bacterium]|nr:divalent-cation tolerance protein CutA [Actinomycetota bacterium]